METVIETKHLKKFYGATKAVNNISFNVHKGEIFGLLGENGAGKTTTLEMIEGIRHSSSGEITVLGLDLKSHLAQIKQRIGVQLQSSAYFGFLTLTEILHLFGSFYHHKVHPLELLKLVDLEEKAGSFVNALSGGQKQRFSIVASLVNDPEIVFLDEPTTGLDPVARRNLWDIIADIKSRGKTIILTTHYMEEAEMLCDRIGIMDAGKIVDLDTTPELIKHVKHPYKINFIDGTLATKDTVELKKHGDLIELAGKSHHYELRLNSKDDLNPALRIVQSSNPDTFTIGKASLEDVFIELTGKTIKE